MCVESFHFDDEQYKLRKRNAQARRTDAVMFITL